MNEQVDQILWKRSAIIDSIRTFFKDRGYLEVETPIVTEYPGMEPHLDYFQTEYVGKNMVEHEALFLNHSPELWMKKLLGRGHEKLFQMGKVFRNSERIENEGGRLYKLHHPEFTMLEWYRAGESYEFMMSETEDLVLYLVNKNCDLDQENCSLISRSWERLSVKEAFIKYCDLNLNELRTVELFRNALLQKGSLDFARDDKKGGGEVSLRQAQGAHEWAWDDLFFWVMLNYIEPYLGRERPTILYDYPASQAALARKNSGDNFWAERFELYIDGVELCNAFGELCDPVEQRIRLEKEQEERREMGKIVPGVDEDFLSALGEIDSAAGNALGVDRLVMLLLGKRDVRDVMVV